MTRIRDLDLAGDRYDRWLVLEFVGILGKARIWKCRCDCGKERLVSTRDLRKGRSRSCGCFAIEVRSINGNARRTHGLKSTPEYRAWCDMISRCENEARSAWPDYGGRGISVCERWRKSFEMFLSDVGRRPTPQHSLDRKNNDGGYSSDNVRWATRIEQANNKRGLRYVVINGERMTIADAARHTGLHYNTFIGRLNRGQPTEEAIKP